MGTTTVDQLGRMQEVMEYLREIDADMTVLTLQALLLVAERPGISMLDVMAKLGVASSTTSRIMSRLGKYGSLGKDGLNLLETAEWPQDRRIKTATLTSRGKRVVERILEKLG